MREKLDSLARQIKRTYDQLKDNSLSVRKSNPSLITKMKKVPLNLSICAVDGGLLSQRMHGADIVVARAVGVNFIYDNSKLKSFSHYPQKSPETEVEIKNSLDEHESNVFRSIIRLHHELKCAIDTVEKFSPLLLLIDGSLLPLPSDRPSDVSPLHTVYLEVLSLFNKLQETCRAKQCTLCGVIKDSRSHRLATNLGFSCSDSLLCSFLLEEGERSSAMPYSDGNQNKDISKLAEKISVFYMKPSKNDLPLRIESLDTDIDKLASIIYSLSAISDNFAYPAILIEADMCAALDGQEMETIEATLFSISGMKPLRRNSRPFR